MAVRVIEQGEDKAKKVYETRCISCRTKFSFQREDAAYWSSMRNEEGLKIACPTCGRDCFTST